MTQYAIPFFLMLITISVMACNEPECDCPCAEPAVESVVAPVKSEAPKAETPAKAEAPAVAE